VVDHMAPFVQLHVHSMFSLLDGVSTPKELTQTASVKGMSALAITDHGTMSGVVEFYDACKNAGIHPVIGCELYVTGDRLVKNKEKKADVSHLTVLAKTNKGLSNLLVVASKADLEGFYYKPRADLSLISNYKKDLIILSGCLKGELASHVLNKSKDAAVTYLERCRDLFGDNFFVEIQPNGIEEQILYNKRVAGLAKRLDIPMVATNDVHYAGTDDWLLQDAMLTIQSGKLLSDEKRMRFSWREFFLADASEMSQMFDLYHPDLKPDIWQGAMNNTASIADMCHIDLEKRKGKLPKIKRPTGMGEEEFLVKLCHEGWHERGLTEISPSYIERLSDEISIICSHGFADYFFVIHDVINFAKSKGIAYGPGRGSAAGSLVAYALGITHVDPLKHDLMFERFINPDRFELPDIDMDFQEDRRQEVKDYLAEKYGADNVASIRVNSSFRIKNAFKDTCRIMGVAPQEANKLTKLFSDYVVDENIEDYLNQDVFKQALAEVGSKDIEKIASGLVGKVRQRGQHAAGVIVARDTLFGSVPLEIVNEQVTSAWDKYSLSRMGYLKLDLLGSRTIKILEHVRQMVKKRTGEVIEWDKLMLDDSKVVKEFALGHTAGIFQFWGPGITRLCQEMRPETFDDIVAINALHRPGPLHSGYTQKYVERKRGREEIPPMNDEMWKITKNTYGLMIYQEQAIRMVHAIAGFTLAEADGVRKAMSSKVGMEKHEKKFIEGATKTVGINEAEEFWKALLQFGAYMFNKAHSTAYSYVAYYTMWAKVYHPLEFMCASLASAPDADRMRDYVYECKRLGIKVVRPNINKSEAAFAIEGESIRAGLSIVKGIGEKTIDAIIKARGKGFKDFIDFVEKVHGQTVKKDAIKSLIKGGAFSQMYPNQEKMLEQFEAVLEIIKKSKKKQSKGQMILFSGQQLDRMTEMSYTKVRDLEEGWR